MPRNYVAKPGAKRYKKYNKELIKQALDELALGNYSLGAIAKKFKISKSVLCRHKNKDMKPHGRPTALTTEEEKYIVENLNICGDWGYPLDTTDLRYIIKMYLDAMNIKHHIFKNNLPGVDYIDGFLKRHNNNISQRICQNIKRSRAAVSPETIKGYFDELGKSLENVPIQNIINYDETNLTDDPGRKKVLVRRGCKYPERVVNHSKGSISLMMAATANGDFLPPYVVYKASHLYDSWTIRGPHNARYNRSSSGWFDGGIFEDWVKTIVLPFMETKEGKKILIGDNLSSHLSIDIIKLCQEKDIHFIFLPSNSTHLTQPLDVAVFRPMKIIWRQLLDKWKKTDDGRTQSCVPKGCFPMLLKLLMEQLHVNGEKNIKAGFRKCGIVPLDANQVLARLPLQEECEEIKKNIMTESFLNLLKDMRFGTMNIKEPRKKRKLEVVAGKSVSAEEIKSNEQEQEPIKSKKKRVLKKTETIQLKPKSLKGKGVGKRTKPITNSEIKTCDLNTLPLVNDNNIIEQATGLSDSDVVVMPFDDDLITPFNISIENMPIVFAENLDCQESTQNIYTHSRENRNENIEKPKIKIISDIKLKLPLPPKKINTNENERVPPKKKKCLNFYKDTEEILKILEEED